MAGTKANPKLAVKKRIAIILISWFAIIGFDLLLHAGLLAKLYTRPGQFLLPAEKAFLRIPTGYLSFLILAIMLVWSMERLNISGWKRGSIFGLISGALVWGAFILGLYSISTADWVLLIAWWIGLTVELGIAGIFAGEGIAGRRLSRLVVWAIVFILLMAIITIALQATGFAPPMARI